MLMERGRRRSSRHAFAEKPETARHVHHAYMWKRKNGGSRACTRYASYACLELGYGLLRVDVWEYLRRSQFSGQGADGFPAPVRGDT